ncbi:flagellar protein [Paenibacillus aurantius]|uniref:Flagellar protein n=1 Tax=Paenibacillus aurantius TaxID=2918900 RepID=A0AA96LGK9_9BACL|nr:flagellar protein [Paenibacillus aurantius]WNQ11596.1 flagellar protein [Paenibacillus aurantius]
MSLNVDNCPRCGKMYQKNPRDLCPSCIKEMDLQYEKCIAHLRANRGIDLQELSEATEVPVRQIIKFIREGRISIINTPNIHYPCEVCGGPIRDQAICDSCRQRLSKEVSNTLEDEKRREELRRQQNQTGFNISERLRDR